VRAAAKFSEDVYPITDLKTRAASIVAQAHRSRRPVLLTKRGRGVAVLLELEEYEALVERAGFVQAVEAGAQAARAGDLYPNQVAMKILDSFGEKDA
jgi:prevent-host-death family protein